MGPGGSISSAGPWPKRNRRRSRLTDITVAVVLPWLVFFLVISLFLFAYHEMKIVVWVLIGLCFCLGFLFLILGATARHGAFLAIGLLCLCSVSVATAVGLWLNSEYLERYWELDSGAEYKDVDPKGDASKTQDAGVIHFLPGSFVDDSRTIGYVASGGIFCVAPVVQPTDYTSKVSYWAVGADCCQQRSDFDCGTAREIGSLSALTEPPRTFYTAAVSQAASVYGLDSTAGSQLVNFVSSPKTVIGDIWDQTLTIALVAMIMDLCMCALAGLVIAKVLLPPPQDSERIPLRK